jgi:hypothetical protein
MKRSVLIIVLSGIFLSSALAQQIEITGIGGYTFTSKAKTYYGDYKVDDNPNYGGILGIGIAPDVFVELTYNRIDTKIRYAYLNVTQALAMSTEYYHVGGQGQIGQGNVKPFGALSIGATRFDLKESYGDLLTVTEWKMSVALSAGAKILLGKSLGIRLQARLGLPMDFNGLYIGTGGSGASFRIPMIQFDLSAGVILRFGGGGQGSGS